MATTRTSKVSAKSRKNPTYRGTERGDDVPHPLEDWNTRFETNHIADVAPEPIDAEAPGYGNALAHAQEEQAPACSRVVVKHVEHVNAALWENREGSRS